jgi:hypothetical protein
MFFNQKGRSADRPPAAESGHSLIGAAASRPDRLAAPPGWVYQAQ